LHCNSNIGRRTTRHAGYRISQVIGEGIKEANSPINIIGRMAQTKFQGQVRVGQMFQFKAARHNLTTCYLGVMRILHGMRMDRRRPAVLK
jgi:hypothetical protein